MSARANLRAGCVGTRLCSGLLLPDPVPAPDGVGRIVLGITGGGRGGDILDRGREKMGNQAQRGTGLGVAAHAVSQPPLSGWSAQVGLFGLVLFKWLVQIQVAP